MAYDEVTAQLLRENERLKEGLREAQRAINSMKVEAETGAVIGDEQAMQEACEQISQEGMEADMAIRAVLGAHGVRVGAPADDRAAFEAWHTAKYGRAYSEWVEAKGRYAWDLTEELWTAWKAARTSGVQASVPINRPATMEEAQHAAQIGACLPNGVLFDAFGRARERYVRVTLNGSHLILHPRELDAFKANEEEPERFTYTDVYLSQEEADALPEFDGF